MKSVKKTKKSISKRIKVTKGGKIKRRARALCHARANKRGIQLSRKKRTRTLALPKQSMERYL